MIWLDGLKGAVGTVPVNGGKKTGAKGGEVMKVKNNTRKAGFTLVELMVVAIIVAILAAVAIPLMTGNKDRAMATEGQAGCDTIATQLRMHYVEHGDFTGVGTPMQLKGLNAGDLNGTYFNDASYALTSLTDGDEYTITATGKAGGDAAGETVIMTVTGGNAVWTGTLLD